MRTLKHRLFISLVFVPLTCLWILARLPSPAEMIVDADGGHQLAGATQILYGEIPFVDFHVTYGPLAFYASAFAQLIFNHRTIGEYVLIIVGYASAYTFLSLLIHRITNRIWIAILFGALALAAIPRLYKYYLVLGPVLTLWTCWTYIDKPSRKNMALIALAITISGLFRADFGIYCLIAGALTVFIHPYFKSGKFIQTLLLFIEIFLLTSPWLVLLFIKGGLLNYFRDMTVGGTNIAVGMSLPIPYYQFNQSIVSSNNLIVSALLLFFCYPFLFLLSLAYCKKDLNKLEYKKLLVTLVLYTFSLLQATHRKDYPHLLQAIPLAFLLAGWTFHKIWDRVWVYTSRSVYYLIALSTILIFVSIPIFLIDQSAWTPINMRAIPSKIKLFSLSNDKLLDNLRSNPNLWQAEVMQYIHRCTTESQHLVALPNLPTFFFYTDRMFGGGQMLIVSGYFATNMDQERMIAKMSSQDIPLIIYQPNIAYDGLKEREFEVVAPKVHTYIENNYKSIIQNDSYNLMLRNDLDIEQQATTSNSFSCPKPKR